MENLNLEILSKKAKIEDLSNQLKKCQNENNLLKLNNSNKTENLENSNNNNENNNINIEDYIEKIKFFEKENEKLSNEIKRNLSQIEILSNENNSYLKEISSFNSLKENYIKEIEEYKNKITSLNNNIEDYENKYKILLKDYSDLKNIKEILSQENTILSEKSSSFIQNYDDYNNLKNQNINLNEEKILLNSKINEIQKLFNDEQEKNKSLNNDLLNKENLYNKKINDLTEEIKKLTDLNDFNLKENLSLKECIDTITKNYDETILSLKTIEKSKNKKIDQLENEIFHFKKTDNNKDNNNNNNDNNNNSFNSNTTFPSLSNKLKEYQNLLQIKENKIKDLETEINKLNEDLNEKEFKIKKFEKIENLNTSNNSNNSLNNSNLKLSPDLYDIVKCVNYKEKYTFYLFRKKLKNKKLEKIEDYIWKPLLYKNEYNNFPYIPINESYESQKQINDLLFKLNKKEEDFNKINLNFTKLLNKNKKLEYLNNSTNNINSKLLTENEKLKKEIFNLKNNNNNNQFFGMSFIEDDGNTSQFIDNNLEDLLGELNQNKKSMLNSYSLKNSVDYLLSQFPNNQNVKYTLASIFKQLNVKDEEIYDLLGKNNNKFKNK